MSASDKADEGEGHCLPDVIGRRAFLQIATAEVARARRHGNPLSCLVIEVDHSTAIDEGRARSAGLSVLQQFVSVCKSTLRASDYIGHIGDDEFAVMLPETPLLSALAVAERILENLSASIGNDSQHRLAATTSIGVAEYEDPTWSLDRLLQVAGAAMLDAKQNGRNQAVCYLDDMQLASAVATVN